MPISIPRIARTVTPAPPALQAGSARIDITPTVGVGLAGHGPTSNAAQGHAGRLFANLLLLEDDTGVRVLLVIADLHAGTRYLHEKLGNRLADIGLSTDRILITASHTHRGPASIYGNHSFDRLTGPGWMDHWSAHFDQDLADAICTRLETVTRSMLGAPFRGPNLITLRPAELALTAPLLWGWLINRTPGALDGMLGPDPAWDFLWSDPPKLSTVQRVVLGKRFSTSTPPPWVGTSPPAVPPFVQGDLLAASPRVVDTSHPVEVRSVQAFRTVEKEFRDFFTGHPFAPLIQLIESSVGKRRKLKAALNDGLLCDARLHTLVAREAGGGDPIGVFAWFNSTPSLVSGKHGVFCSDAFGHAGRVLREQIAIPGGVAGGAQGDSNLAPRGMTLKQVRKSQNSLDASRTMVRKVGEAIGAALLDCVTRPLVYRSDLVFVTSYADYPSSDIDDFAFYSAPGLAGSDLESAVLSFIGEGRRSAHRYADVQAPKARFARFEAPPAQFPLRRLEIRTPTDPWWSLVAMPAECSVSLASDIAARLGGGSHPVTVSSPAGEFVGYAGTPFEYVAQGYEGGSAYYGMWTGWKLLEAVDTGLSTAQPMGSAVFSGTAGSLPLRVGSSAKKPNAFAGGVKLFSKGLNALRQHGRPDFRMVIEDGQTVLRLSFKGALPPGPLWDQRLVSVLFGPAQTPWLLPSGLELDDRTGDAVLFVKKGRHRTRWFIEVRIPGTAVAGAYALRVDGAITETGGPILFG